MFTLARLPIVTALVAAFGAIVLVTACSTPGLAQGVRPAILDPLVERSIAAPGSTIRVALEVSLPAGLHAQSNAPRDPALIPASLAFALPEGVSLKEVVFPQPIDFPMPGFDQPLAVFERTFVVGVVLALDSSVPTGPLEIPAQFRYQACDDTSCFPPRTLPVSWTIEVGPPGAASPGRAEIFGQIRWGTGRPQDAATPFVPPSAAPATATPSTSDAELVALFEQFEVTGSGGYTDAAGFIEFIRNAEAGITPKGWLEGRGPVAILAIVFIGGLALNLTPCVLPMIPINLGIIGAGAYGKKGRRGFLLGATYGAAMALVYGVLGVIVILTAGTFGALNASPWFNAGIAALFVVLGLAMFDVIPIDFSRFSSAIKFKSESGGTFMLAFGMGTVAALLAGACVAPVVIQVVVFASDLYAKGTTIALALPFVLGLGMAIPWPIAGAGMAALPRPGAWMNYVKYAMGVFILATAAYYGYIAYGIIESRSVDPAEVRAGVAEKLKDGWYGSPVEGLRIAARDRTPVLIDFWATWCKNCAVMDVTTLADPAVVTALGAYTKIKFQSEDPEAPPAKTILARLPRVVGLPHYAILKPRP